MKLQMKVEARGLLDAFKKAPFETAKELRVEMKSQMSHLQRDAREHHRFVARTGMLERSVQFQVERSGLAGKAYLETGLAPYGVYVHQGHHVGRGKGGWKPDKFLYEAFDRLKPQFLREMGKAIDRALRKVGLK